MVLMTKEIFMRMTTMVFTREESRSTDGSYNVPRLGWDRGMMAFAWETRAETNEGPWREEDGRMKRG